MNLSYARHFFAGVVVATSRKSNDADEDSDKNTVGLIANRCTRVTVWLLFYSNSPLCRLKNS